MVELRKAIRDLAVLAIGVLVVDVVFETVGLALASLNTAVANLSSYVSVSSLASVVNTLIPIERFTSFCESCSLDVVFIIAAIAVLLELFGAEFSTVKSAEMRIPNIEHRRLITFNV